MIIDAPGKGNPDSSEIVPVIDFSCACKEHVRLNKNRNNPLVNNFFIKKV
jgi:hypothetical protein